MRVRSRSRAIRARPTRRSSASWPRHVQGAAPGDAIRPRLASSSSRNSTPPATSCRSSASRPRWRRATRRSSSQLGLQRSGCRDTLCTATRRSKSSFRLTRRLAGVYVQAISAYAPHPNAAKLWMEHLYSDEGQSAGSRATATRSASTTLSPTTDPGRRCCDKLPPADAYEKPPCSRPLSRSTPTEVAKTGWDTPSAQTSQ